MAARTGRPRSGAPSRRASRPPRLQSSEPARRSNQGDRPASAPIPRSGPARRKSARRYAPAPCPSALRVQPEPATMTATPRQTRSAPRRAGASARTRSRMARSRARSAHSRIVAQCPDDRNPGQNLAADRAGIGELPARLRPDHPGVDQPLFGELALIMAAVMRRAEKFVRAPRRTSPERKPAAGNAPIEPRADLEPVVAVALVVRDQRGDLVPYGAPRRLAGKPKPAAKPAG